MIDRSLAARLPGWERQSPPGMEGVADGLTAPATATDQRGITIQANAIEPFGQKHRTTVSLNTVPRLPYQPHRTSHRTTRKEAEG